MPNVKDTSRRAETLLGEIARLQTQFEQHSRSEASALQNLSSSQRRLSSSGTSFRASSQRDVERYSNQLLEIQRKKADLQATIARKNAELSKAQAEHLKAEAQEARERVVSDQKIRREQARREEALHREIAELRGGTRTVAAGAGRAPQYDLFISHASQDKEEVVRPLAARLASKGIQVWLDETVLKVGDSLRRSIDLGLSRSRFGVVVLSQAFFAKNWPQYELDGLVAKENMHGTKVVLPIWHKVTKDEVVSFSPTLADRVALNTGVQSLDDIATELASVVG